MAEYLELTPSADTAWENFAELDFRRYLGNTVMIGISPDGVSFQQVCWLLGRDDHEKNRQFRVAEWKQGEYVETVREPENGKVIKPYPTMLSASDPGARRELHVVTTGDRTRAILSAMLPDPHHGRPQRQPFGTNHAWYDPEQTPTRTVPRVSGLLNIGDGAKHVNFGMFTRGKYTEIPERPLRTYAAPGVALTAHSYTYNPQTGKSEPSEGVPYVLPLLKDAAETRDFWWEQLPEKYRVAIAVVSIYGATRTYAIRNEV